MKIVNSNYDQAPSSRTTDMETEKAPTTFLSLPAELRNDIYKLSGCLKAQQSDDLISNGRCGDWHSPAEPCIMCLGCSKDLSQCFLCFHPLKSEKITTLWVNRNSSFAATSNRDDTKKKQNLRHRYVNHNGHLKSSAAKH